MFSLLSDITLTYALAQAALMANFKSLILYLNSLNSKALIVSAVTSIERIECIASFEKKLFINSNLSFKGLSFNSGREILTGMILWSWILLRRT